MAEILASIHVTSWQGLGLFFVVWFLLFRCAHVLVTLMRHEPLIGWAIGPLGITMMFLHEPSLAYIWLDVVCPAVVSASVVYFGLFTSISPLALPHYPLFVLFIVATGVAISSTRDVINALHDLRHPLWGEVRILRNVQLLRARYAKIHFTSFGYSYLNDHFGYSPTDLLQAL